MKLIPLSKGYFAQVDDEDYSQLAQWRWCVNNGGYAIRNVREGGKLKQSFMHREIIKTPAGLDTDHRDGNRLNNQRENLRKVSRSQNCYNQRKTRGTSRYKGVYWYKRRKRWRAQIKFENKQISLGLFKCEISAARTYNASALKYFGEFARLNVLPSDVI